MRILAIDDERPALNLLTDTLKALLPDAEITALRHAQDFDALENKTEFDAAFLDIEIGQVNGIRLALKIKQAAPLCNIIFVTAHSKYAAESFEARPSGYVLKPYTKEDIRRELSDLRHPVAGAVPSSEKLRVVTFGSFMVYNRQNEPMHFTRTLSKEILAYLIDQCGFAVTSKDIAADVLEEQFFDERVSKRVSKLVNLLIEDLNAAGYPGVVIKQNRQLSINRALVDCDLYRTFEGDLDAVNSFRGEYLIDYSWAEFSDSADRIGRA